MSENQANSGAKSKFALLVIDQKSGSKTGICSKRRVLSKSSPLVSLCEKRGLTKLTISGNAEEVSQRLAGEQFTLPQGPVLIAGSPSADVLASACELLREGG